MHLDRQKITPSASEIILHQTNVVTTTLAVPPVAHAQRKKTSQQTTYTYRSAWRFGLRFALQLVSAVVVRVALCRWFLWRVSWRKIHLPFSGKENPTYKTHATLARTVSQHIDTMFTWFFTSKFPNLQTMFPHQATALLRTPFICAVRWRFICMVVWWLGLSQHIDTIFTCLLLQNSQTYRPYSQTKLLLCCARHSSALSDNASSAWLYGGLYCYLTMQTTLHLHGCMVAWTVTTHRHHIYIIFTSKFPNLQTNIPRPSYPHYSSALSDNASSA